MTAVVVELTLFTPGTYVVLIKAIELSRVPCVGEFVTISGDEEREVVKVNFFEGEHHAQIAFGQVDYESLDELNADANSWIKECGYEQDFTGSSQVSFRA